MPACLLQPESAQEITGKRPGCLTRQHGQPATAATAAPACLPPPPALPTLCPGARPSEALLVWISRVRVLCKLSTWPAAPEHSGVPR